MVFLNLIICGGTPLLEGDVITKIKDHFLILILILIVIGIGELFVEIKEILLSEFNELLMEIDLLNLLGTLYNKIGRVIFWGLILIYLLRKLTRNLRRLKRKIKRKWFKNEGDDGPDSYPYSELDKEDFDYKIIRFIWRLFKRLFKKIFYYLKNYLKLLKLLVTHPMKFYTRIILGRRPAQIGIPGWEYDKFHETGIVPKIYTWKQWEYFYGPRPKVITWEALIKKEVKFLYECVKRPFVWVIGLGLEIIVPEWFAGIGRKRIYKKWKSKLKKERKEAMK